MQRRSEMRALALLAVLALGGCGPLVQIGGNDKAPVALLTLRATATPGAPAADLTRSVSVVTPNVPGPLQTLRLPVIQRDTELAYLTGATWAEQPNKLFARVLADTIAASGVAVLDARQTSVGAARTLGGTLVEFSLDVRSPASPAVVLRYDALLTGDGGKTIAIRRFDRRVPVASQAPGDVAIALNGAANAVAGEVAAWLPQ